MESNFRFSVKFMMTRASRGIKVLTTALFPPHSEGNQISKSQFYCKNSARKAEATHYRIESRREKLKLTAKLQFPPEFQAIIVGNLLS